MLVKIVFPGLHTAVFSLCVPTWAFLSVCSWVEGAEWVERSLSFSCYKATNPIGLGPHPYDFIIQCLFKVLAPEAVTPGLRLQHMNFEGATPFHYRGDRLKVNILRK